MAFRNLSLRKAALLIGLIAAVGPFATANAVTGFFGIPFATKTEARGKLTVKLTKTFSLQFPEVPTAVAWAPDGSILGVASDFGSRFDGYDSSGHAVSTFKNSGSQSVVLRFLAFVGNSQVLFPVEDSAGAEAALYIRDVKTGQIAKTITRPLTKTYRPIGTDVVAVSPDQKHFAIANGYSGQAIIYGNEDSTDWHELAATNETVEGFYKFGAVSLCFFPDNKRIAIGKSQGHFAVADSTTGETLKEFKAYVAPGVHNNIAAIATHPTQDLILTGMAGVGIAPQELTPKADAWEKSDHPVASVWRISDGKEVASFRDKGEQILQAVWDPKGRFTAFLDTDSLIVWQPEVPGQNYLKLPLGALSASLAITQDGKSLAVASGKQVTVYTITDN